MMILKPIKITYNCVYQHFSHLNCWRYAEHVWIIT